VRTAANQLWLSGTIRWVVRSVAADADAAVIEFVDDLAETAPTQREAVIRYVAEHLWHTGRFRPVRVSACFPTARLVAKFTTSPPDDESA
jgi:hypothetical protein